MESSPGKLMFRVLRDGHFVSPCRQRYTPCCELSTNIFRWASWPRSPVSKRRGLRRGCGGYCLAEATRFSAWIQDGSCPLQYLHSLQQLVVASWHVGQMPDLLSGIVTSGFRPYR